jgi:hypothetical protein
VRATGSQVAAHDDEQIGVGGYLFLETVGVLHRLFGGMDGAWADDDKDAVVQAGDDAGGLEACMCDGGTGAGRGDDFVLDEGGLDERIILDDVGISVGGEGVGGVWGCAGRGGGRGGGRWRIGEWWSGSG